MVAVKPLSAYNLILGIRILRYHPQSFLSGVIEGERGYGKSMYALKVMAQVYYALNGRDEDRAWDTALRNMLFRLEDVTSFINYNIENDIITPAWCIDDATVHLSAYKFFTNLYEVMQIHGMFNTIRTICTGLLLTCPDRKLLLAPLRNYDDFKIMIQKAPGDPDRDRVAKGYKIYTTPIGQKRVYKNFEDYYSVIIPNWIYYKYLEKRKYYLKMVNEELQNIIQKRKDNSKMKDIETNLHKIKLKHQIEDLQKKQLEEEMQAIASEQIMIED